MLVATLQAAREARGWSKAELARRAGMHPATVGSIENGRLVPYPVQIEKLASALEISAESLAERAAPDAAPAGPPAPSAA